MLRRIVHKIVGVIPILLVTSFILFALINMLPGDAALSILAEGSTQEDLQRLREDMGITQPIIVQYWQWISGMIRGNLGKSLLTGQSISHKLSQRLPVTLELSFLAIMISVLIAVPAGILSATRRNSVLDVIANFFCVVGIAMPSFWLGMLLIIQFSINLNWLPASGFVPFLESPVENLRRMVLPALTIGFAFTATIMRQTRSAMLEVLSQDYILTARAKGIKSHCVLYKHALRNALIPVVTVISMQMGRLVGGAVVTETVFALPGIGREIVDSIMARDYPVAMALIMIVVFVVIMMNLLADILYILIDPRISNNLSRNSASLKGGRLG